MAIRAPDGANKKHRKHYFFITEVRSGCGPRHMAFHPSRPFAYVLCELLPLVLVYRSNLKYNDLNTSKVHPSVFHVGTENGGNR